MTDADDNSTLAAICDSHLFKSLDDQGRLQLLAGATSESYASGVVIVREGDPGDALYIVKRGRVEVHTTQEGQAVHLAKLGRGACFGEVALLSGRARTATVIAEEDSVLLRFGRQHIESVLEAYPRVKQLLEAVVKGRARATIEKLVGEPEA